jgi:cephalosporin hydroxylase
MAGATPASGPSGDDVDPLTRIALRHGTDKWGAHFYTPVYHQLFAHLRDRPVRLLEIGIGGYEFARLGGASLAMWADYFPNGHILGVDVHAKTLDLGPRVTVQQGSQNDAAFLARMSAEHGPFDIVIDDGSHVPAHVIASFNVLFPLLADNGLYVIEDVQTAYWPDFGGAPDGGVTMQLARAMLDHVNHAEIQVAQPEYQVPDLVKSIRSFRAWHNIFAIEKGDNSEPSNFAFRPDNVHAARSLRTIKDELARAPTASGYANLIDVHIRGSNLRDAWHALEEALARWPGEPVVLHAAYSASLQSGNPTLALEFLRRLAALEPDNDALQERLRKAEAEAASGGR